MSCVAPGNKARMEAKQDCLTDNYAEMKQDPIGGSELPITGGMQAEVRHSVCRILQREIKPWVGAGTRWMCVLPPSRVRGSGVLI